MPVLVLGLSHRTSSVDLRERFAFAESTLPDSLATLRQNGLADEAVILSTCNRVELYAVSSAGPEQALPPLREFLTTHAGVTEPLDEEIYSLPEPDSIHHLFRVVSGLDSMVLGETEILGQTKKAYDLALKHGHSGSRLNKVFQRAFNVAKQIRTDTSIQRGSVSVASVAVELAGKIFESLKTCKVLVLGAGDTSEKAARAMLSRGAKELLVSNRTWQRAETLASELGGQAIPFDQWPEVALDVQIIISSTAAQNYVIRAATIEPLMKRRRYRPLLLVDIAVPRDIDPAINNFENVYLYNIDNLQMIADDSLQQRREEIDRCEALIRDRAAALLTDPRRPPWVPSQPRLTAGSDA